METRKTDRYDAVMFDLLTALLDSWTLWNRAAGSDESGMRWRRKYLELTYQAGAYRPYADIVRESAGAAEVSAACATRLLTSWSDLQPWPEAHSVLAALVTRVPLAVATNCSAELGRTAVACSGGTFASVSTAEAAGYYKPRPEPYLLALKELGTSPERTLFVAGSAADVPGAMAVGMPVYWHNRMGLKPLDGARPDFMSDSLEPLLRLV